MNHFLHKAAQYIYNQHNINELANISIILPTRRGTVLFKKELGKLSTKPFIAPKVISIEDFILTSTKLELLEPIDLVFELYNSIKTEDPTVKFELFMSWAPTLLKDFETIDQYLVNARQLFNFMTEAKAMERWNISEINSKNTHLATSVNKYFELFKTLYTVYENFNRSLKNKGKAYRGSAYRFLAENIETLLLEQNEIEKYYFLGFNALSLSEHKIIKSLVEAKKAETLWDSDEYYMGNLAKGQLAGKFLKNLKKEAELGKWNWLENELLTGSKTINIIGLNHQSQQPIVASHFLKLWASNTFNKSEIALVLADEAMLGTVLKHIPTEIGNYNITMGLGLKASPIFNLLENIFELNRFQKNDKFDESKINSRLLINILHSNLVKDWFFSQEINLNEKVIEIQNLNQLYISKQAICEFFHENNLVLIIIEGWENSTINAIQNIKKTVNIIFENIQNHSQTVQLYYQIFEKIFNRVEEIIHTNEAHINISALKSILFEIIRQTKLPFETNSTDQLQIMGMLETRTLDFERIIVLSANEGHLPAGKKAQSLIPFDALMELNMPTYGHQDAIMAYHFFRLLQQAKEVVILYTKPNANNGNNEKSRFILQIEHELALLNRNIKLEYPEIKFDFERNEKSKVDFQIEKNDEIISKIKEELSTKGLFATALNEFIACPLQYYFNRIAKIKEPNEIDENIGNDVFGLWVHKTLEMIDIEHLNKGIPLEKAHLIEIKNSIRQRLMADFNQYFNQLSIEEGMNLILLNVAEKVLTGYFENEINTAEFPQEVLAVEVNLHAENEILYQNKPLIIKIGGKIDKLTKIGNKIRIIDYKTGKVDTKNLDLKPAEFENNIEKILTDSKLDKFRQLWLYRYLYLKNKAENPSILFKKLSPAGINEVEAGIFSFRNNKAGFIQGPNFIGHPTETNEEFLRISEEIIEKIVLKILDKNQAFTMTADLKTCEYCNYKSICNR